MTHSMKYKRLAKKLGVKGSKPGDLISKMHSLKGMPKAKKHKQISWSTQPAQSNVMGKAPKAVAPSQPMAQQRPAGLAMPKPNLANAVSGMKFKKSKKSKKHKFGDGKGLKTPTFKKHKSFGEWAKEEEKEPEHKKKHKAVSKSLDKENFDGEKSFKKHKEISFKACKVHKKVGCKVC